MSSSVTDDPLARLSRALDQFRTLAAEVTPDQGSLPTPCQSWDVRTLIEHTIQIAHRFEKSLRGDAAAVPADAAAEGDLMAQLRGAEDALISAWRQPGVTERIIQLPFGERPAMWSIAQQAVEFTLHSWDLARALDRVDELDQELAEQALEFGRENIKREFRGDEASGKSFGVEIPVPADADAYARLAGFFGRDPS